MKKSTATLLRAALATTILATTACTVHTADPALTVISADNTAMRTDRGLVPDMIEDWEFTRLETSPESLLDQMTEFALVDGLIFVYSRPGNVNVGQTPVSLKVFDATGKYLRDIGIFGRAANNYLTIRSWLVDRAGKTVTIVDVDKILRYDFEGDLLETFPISPDLWGVAQMGSLPDGNVLGHDWVMGSTDVQIRLMDGRFNTVDTLAMRLFSLGDENGFSRLGSPWMSTFGDHVLVAKEFSDTIYTYRQGRLHPEMVLEFARSMDGIDLYDGINRAEAQARLDERNYNQKKMSDIYETGDHVLTVNNARMNALLAGSGMEYPTRMLVWNKAAGRGVLLGESEKISQVPRGRLVCTDGDRLVAVLEAWEVLEYRDECARLGVEITPRMAALFDGLGEQDNPVLIKYRLKNELR